MTAGARKLLGPLLALALLAALPAAASAQIALPIRAVFLKEYSKPNYVMNQGEIISYENDDPFLRHGVVGEGFFAPTSLPGGSRLVRGAPFLHAGTYAFHDSVYPEMTSTLTVTSSGAPLPPDNGKPSAKLKIVGHSAGQIKVRVAPSEPVDVALSAFSGGARLGAALPRAFIVPGARAAMSIVLEPGAKGTLGGRLVEVRAKITDAAGNATKLRKTRRL